MGKTVKPAGKTANASRRLTMHGTGAERRAMKLAGDLKRDFSAEKPRGGRKR